MATITIPRADVTPEEVSRALRDGLGPRYHVLPGTQASYSSFGMLRPDQPDAIVVGSGRLWRTQVRIDRRNSQTRIRVTPRGLSLILLINMLGITRKVGRVLRNSPGLDRD